MAYGSVIGELTALFTEDKEPQPELYSGFGTFLGGFKAAQSTYRYAFLCYKNAVSDRICPTDESLRKLWQRVKY